MATQDISQLVVEVQSKGIQTAATQLDRLALSSDKAEKAVKKLGTSVVGVNGTLSGGVAQSAALVAALNALTAVMGRLSQSQLRATQSTRQNNDAMREAHALARGLSGSLGALWVTYGNLAGMAAGIALGAGMKEMVTTGADVEHTLEQIRVLAESTTKEVDLMRQSIYELGQGAKGPKDVAEAYSVLSLAGLNATQAIQGVPAAMDLAVAGGVSIEKASSTLVQVGTALGYTADQYGRVADVITKTAAVSMSSVEGISASFKTAASVGELYGATLTDIGVGLAALSNLGIGFTAAGTSLKNFYGDLSDGSRKVQKAFAAMQMKQSDLKDAEGYFIPVIDLVKKLDAGLSKLNGPDRVKALNDLFKERGVKEGTALIKMLHTTSNEFDAAGNRYANKLEEISDRVNKSYAFATLSAIAMSQTTQSQMKAVGNTLQTSLIQAFKDVQPQIGNVTRALKEAFSSPEFINGIKTVATAIANLTVGVISFGKEIGIVIAVLAAWKIAAFAGSLVTMATGFGAAATGAALFGVALGPVAIAITALGAAWAYYNSQKDRSITNFGEQKNLQDFSAAVLKAAEKERTANEMRAKGMDEAAIARNQQMEDDKAAAALAIKQSEASLKAMRDNKTKLEAEMNGGQKLMAQRAMKNNIDTTSSALVDSYIRQTKQLTQAEISHANQVKITMRGTELLTKEREKAAAAADAAARNALIKPTGDGGFKEEADKAAISQAYYAAIQTQEQAIANARTDMDNQRELAQLQRRAGLITELDMVYKIGAAEKTFNAIRVAAIAEEAKIAASAKGRGPDVERYNGELTRAKEEQLQSVKVLELKALDASFAAVEAATNAKIKTEELLGNFRAAAALKWDAENKKSYEDAIKNAETYGGIHVGLVHQFEERKKAAIAEGAVKEEMKDFEIAAQRTQNTLKGFKADNVGKSWVQVWQAATKATARYNEELAEATKEYQDLRDMADAPGATDSAMKAAEESQGRLLKLSESFRQMWTGTGEQIAKSLETAFGTAGKALGDMVKLSADYQAQKDKSFESDMSHYGNLAGAASGFFDKQSKGFKVLNTVAQMFHIASMARTLAQTAASVAAGAAQFFAQSGWAGFAGVAAMGVVMAGLGYGMGGSSGGGQTAEEVQKTQGTGGVFGDAEAKSESITKSIELLETNSNFMLPLTQAMKNSLVNIESAMVGLTNLVLRTDGVSSGTNMGINLAETKNGAGIVGITELFGGHGPMGKIWGGIASAILGKTTKKIVDAGIQFEGTVAELQAGIGYEQYASVDTTKKSFFGLSKKTTNKIESQGLGDELSSQFGLIFSNLETALATAGPTFGKTADEVSKAIDGLVIETGVSLKDLKGEDLTNAINGVISKTMDQIAEAAFPSLGAFRQVGEGYAQTVIRVATGVEQANLALEGFGVKALKFTEITNKTGDVAFEITKQSIALSEAGSGVGKLIETFTGSIEDITKAYQLLIDIRYQMNSTGLGKGLNQDTIKGAGGADKLASAMDTYYKKYFSDSERLVIETTKMTEQFGALGMALPASRDQLRTWIEAAASAGDQTTVGKLLSLTSAFDDLMGTVKETAAELDLTKIRKFMELLGLGSGVSMATVDAAGGLDALSSALDTYYAGFFSSTERVALETKRVTSQFAELGMALPGSRDELRAWIEAAAKAGDQTAIGKLLGLTGAFGSLMDLISQADEDNLQAGIDAAQSAYDKAMEGADAAYDSLERAISKEKEAIQKIVDSSKESISALKTVLDELDKAIKSTAPSVTQAQAFSGAMTTVRQALMDVRGGASLGKMDLSNSFDALGSDDQSEYSSLFDFQRDQAYANNLLTELKVAGQGQLTEAEKVLAAAEKQIEKLDEQLQFAKDQLDALKGVDNSVKSVAMAMGSFVSAVANAAGAKAGLDAVKNPTDKNSAIESLYASLLGRSSDKAGKDYWLKAMEQGMSLSEVSKLFTSSDEYKSKIPSFDVGTNNVPEDMLAMVHKGERIIPAADNVALEKKLDAADAKGSTTNADVVAAIKDMKDSIEAGDLANVLKTGDLFKIIRDWDNRGTPEHRDETE